ncbi:MAG: hypothetical protein HOQ27_10655 [Dermatophilaceae bacterium]|nr:hypothetical protein [Dermatophilaceae bacterium]
MLYLLLCLNLLATVALYGRVKRFHDDWRKSVSQRVVNVPIKADGDAYKAASAAIRDWEWGANR